MIEIETAVIPAAGKGLRMRPLTAAVPKEMFPLGNSALIEYTIRELVASGIRRICVVIREGKEIIKECLIWRKKFYNKVDLYFVYQKEPLGLGDALRCAKDFISGMPFIMAITDQILLSKVPATRQLLDACRHAEGIWNFIVEIPDNEADFFKGSRSFKYKKIVQDLCVIEDISTDKTSPIRGFGRTLYLPEALEYMTKEYINNKTGEVDLLKTFQALKKNSFPLYGTILEGIPCDLGTWEGYYYYQHVILGHLNSEGESL
ncbi:MAG: sugar phosphate nucleotidyltransferase [bacterium]|nr:sugar phosphate nucleotidyltransferase [bacterium]